MSLCSSVRGNIGPLRNIREKNRISPQTSFHHWNSFHMTKVKAKVWNAKNNSQERKFRIVKHFLVLRLSLSAKKTERHVWVRPHSQETNRSHWPLATNTFTCIRQQKRQQPLFMTCHRTLCQTAERGTQESLSLSMHVGIWDGRILNFNLPWFSEFTQTCLSSTTVIQIKCVSNEWHSWFQNSTVLHIVWWMTRNSQAWTLQGACTMLTRSFLNRSDAQFSGRRVHLNVKLRVTILWRIVVNPCRPQALFWGAQVFALRPRSYLLFIHTEKQAPYPDVGLSDGFCGWPYFKNFVKWVWAAELCSEVWTSGHESASSSIIGENQVTDPEVHKSVSCLWVHVNMCGCFGLTFWLPLLPEPWHAALVLCQCDWLRICLMLKARMFRQNFLPFTLGNFGEAHAYVGCFLLLWHQTNKVERGFSSSSSGFVAFFICSNTHCFGCCKAWASFL